MGGGQTPPSITKSPTKNGSNHHITNKKWPKSPSPSGSSDHQSPRKNFEITKYFQRQNDSFCLLLLLFQTCTNHKITNKKQVNHHHQSFSKSPNHQFFQVLITKSPTKKLLNHHHHNFSRSPNHQFFYVQITKSPTKKQPNHQSPKILAPPPIDTQR